ncbi:GerMN domain-containing protein [Calderihabitans maritimus]|uniref:Spore germination protein n=1 Tax=Calderihabitans maritimus TaxID=1246530 RepID=A0A1Z5HP09_9FIRM|nr:GerMN domain-containing protein [Calderihabitans maritimus]GAW91269.1 spore germination protein [Calderihabitans maritimus]
MRAGKRKILSGMLIMMLFAALLAVTSGCSILDNLLSMEDRLPEPEVQKERADVDVATPDIQMSGEEMVDIVLYFSDPEGRGLVAETRTIPKVEGIARATVQELILGPDVESGLRPTIPPGTVLRDINIRPDGLCRVDFSRELINNHPGGSLEEQLTVYSIVNTLTQFPTVERVEILVEGRYVDTIAGHVDVSEAMARNDGIIISQ